MVSHEYDETGEYRGAEGETTWKEAVPVPVQVSVILLEFTPAYVGWAVGVGNGLP